MTPPKILCVGALTADLMLRVPALPAGPGKWLAEAGAFVAAGMAASAATAATRLGARATLWASVGDDPLGEFLVGEMAREGIDTRLIRRVPETLSAVAAVTVDHRGERTVVPFYAEPLLRPAETVPDLSGYAAVLVDVRWPAAAAPALDAARQHGIASVLDLDVGPALDLRLLARGAGIVVASRDGARVLTGAETPAEAAAALREFCEVAVVTDGARGTWWTEPDGAPRHMAAFGVRAVDTNAAGDVFHGAFAVGLAEAMPLVDAIRFASAAAAIKCTRHGGRAGAPNRAEVDAFLAGHPVPGDEPPFGAADPVPGGRSAA